MSEPHAGARILTHRRQLGRLTPRRFTRPAWYRFSRDRRAGYIRRIGSDPDERQALLIEQMVQAEWSALVCDRRVAEAEARVAEAKGARAKTNAAKDGLEAMRRAAEFRRMLILLDRDLNRATPRPAPTPAAPPKTLAEHLAAIEAGGR
jgi:hypothetical protein